MRTILIAFILLFFPGISHGQLFNTSAVTTQPTLSFTPTYPEPGQDVKVRIDNFYTVGNAAVSWFVGEDELVNERNNQSITITLPDSTDTTTITAAIESSQTGSRLLERTIRPLYVDIVFEPQTHVPQFYKGRALPSADSVVNATVLLFGTALAKNDLFYTWKVDGKNVENGIGRGKHSVSFKTTKSWETVVSVEVKNTNGVVVASKAVSLPNVKPALVFYETNPLYGVVERPLSSFNLISNSATVLAEPYYLDSRVYNSPDVALWNLDGTDTISNGNPYEMTFERTGFNGVAKLGFTVRSLSSLLQIASDEINVTY